MDRNFINSLLNNEYSPFNQSEIISFDIFDTAATRSVSAPKHIFALVVEKAKEFLTKEQYKEFIYSRIQAENKARTFARDYESREEVSLVDIYNNLKNLLNLSDSVANEIMQLEIDIEIDNIVPVKPIQDIYHYALKEGKKVIFVSDMYLPQVALEKVLEKCGYDQYSDFFLSSKLMLTKGSGRLWKKVISQLAVQPKTILHFGDNPHGDIMRAEENGINTVYFPNLSQDLKNRDYFSPHIIPLSKLIQKNKLNDIFCEDIYKIVGRNYLPILYISYVKWIAENAQKMGIQKIFFLSRDSYIIKKVWDILAEHQQLPQDIQACYLEVSRKSLIISSIEDLNPAIMEFLLSGGEKGRTVKTFIERTGLVLTKEIESKMQLFFTSQDHIISSEGDYANLKALFLQLRPEIFELSRAARNNVIAYFQSAGLFDKSCRSAIVDLGWQGNMQKSIKKIINFVDKDINISGFYLGLIRNALSKIHTSGYMCGMIYNGMQHPNFERKLGQTAALLEALHSAPQGSVKSYSIIDGKPVVQYQDNALERSVYESMIGPLHSHALDTVTAIASNQHIIAVADLNQKVAYEVVEELLILPNSKEIDLFGNIRHFDGYEHSGSGVSLIPFDQPLPQSEEEAFAIMSHYPFWPPGLLIYWKNQANEDTLPMLRRLAEHFRYLGEDWLNSFYH